MPSLFYFKIFSCNGIEEELDLYEKKKASLILTDHWILVNKLPLNKNHFQLF